MPFLFIFFFFSTNSPSFSKSHSLLHPLSIHSRSPCHLVLLSHPFPSLFLLHIGYIRLYNSLFRPISLVFPIYQTISHFPVHHSPPVERYPLFHILIHNFTPTFFPTSDFPPIYPSFSRLPSIQTALFPPAAFRSLLSLHHFYRLFPFSFFPRFLFSLPSLPSLPPSASAIPPLHFRKFLLSFPLSFFSLLLLPAPTVYT